VFPNLIVLISKRAGLPVQVYKYTHYEHWKDSPEIENAWGNRPATLLYMEAYPDKESWGWAPLQYQIKVGNVLIIGHEGDVKTSQLRLCVILGCSRCLKKKFRE